MTTYTFHQIGQFHESIRLIQVPRLSYDDTWPPLQNSEASEPWRGSIHLAWQWHFVYHDGGPVSCPVCTEAAYHTALDGAAQPPWRP